jgi:hypothetical protein
MEDNKDVKGIDKKQIGEVNKLNIEHIKKTYIDGLLRLYQSAKIVEVNTDSTLGKDIKSMVVNELSKMINIVERNDWDSVHPHEAFPDIDIRMLAYECPASIDCPFIRAILKVINMSHADYFSYKERLGKLIVMERQRKLGRTR